MKNMRYGVLFTRGQRTLSSNANKSLTDHVLYRLICVGIAIIVIIIIINIIIMTIVCFMKLTWWWNCDYCDHCHWYHNHHHRHRYHNHHHHHHRHCVFYEVGMMVELRLLTSLSLVS